MILIQIFRLITSTAVLIPFLIELNTAALFTNNITYPSCEVKHPFVPLIALPFLLNQTTPSKDEVVNRVAVVFFFLPSLFLPDS